MFIKRNNNRFHNNKFFRSLQTRSNKKSGFVNFRMICSNNQDGAAVVEAAAAIPIFICAICSLLMIGQMLLIQTQVKYALSKTAGIYAGSEAVFDENIIRENLELNSEFRSLIEGNQLCQNGIVGGKEGIIITGKREEYYVSVTASYLLKVPVPYFNGISFPIKCTIQKRIFSGYVDHEREGTERDPVVYVAEYGTVYHRKMTCSHICLKISDAASIQDITGNSSHKPCKKCIHPGESYVVLYLTVHGDAYHSTLMCSGLKRTIKAIRLSQTGGMKPCSRCGAS